MAVGKGLPFQFRHRAVDMSKLRKEPDEVTQMKEHNQLELEDFLANRQETTVTFNGDLPGVYRVADANTYGGLTGSNDTSSWGITVADNTQFIGWFTVQTLFTAAGAQGLTMRLKVDGGAAGYVMTYSRDELNGTQAPLAFMTDFVLTAGAHTLGLNVDVFGPAVNQTGAAFNFMPVNFLN